MAKNNNKSLFKTIKHSICVSLILVTPVDVYAQDEATSISITNQATDTSISSPKVSDTVSPNFDEDNKASYGPILNSDTLWKIAVAHRPNTTVSNYQVMMALFNTNPNAFLRNDINTLVEGQFLRVPTLEEIRQIPPYPYGKENAEQTSKTTEISEAPAKLNTSVEEISVLVVNDKEEIAVSTAIESKAEVEITESSITDTTALTDNTKQEDGQGSVETLKAENSELKESLNAVDDQLSYLQYEVAKATEMQVQMDNKLAQQNELLKEAKIREQKLLVQQRKLTEHQQSFFNNPITYWSINGLLAILVIILFVLVSRRKKMEQAVNNSAQQVTDKNDNQPSLLETSEPTIEESVKEPIADNIEVPNVAFEEVQQADAVEASAEINAIETTQEPSENEHVVTAFTSIELTSEKQELEILDDKDFLAKLVPGGLQENRNEDNVKIQATEDDLDIEQIIDDMLDEESKPAKLRSARAPLEELVPVDEVEDEAEVLSPKISEVHEINDYDDVEFDKLLAEISAESEHVKPPSNVTPLRRTVEIKEHATASVVKQIKPEKEYEDFIAVDTLLEESALAEELDESVFDQHKIDVGLDEFPEFTSQVNHVNVDDDKHGVNAKLDLAQVYVEIGDLDNAAVILKSVMKLGNSGQQQQAQDLLYSIK